MGNAPACSSKPQTEADVYGDEEVSSFTDDPVIHARLVQTSWMKIPGKRGAPSADPMMNMIPATFAEMYAFNQPVMQQFDESKKGISMDFTQEIIPVFGQMVESAMDPVQFKKLCDDLAPKITAKGATNEGMEFFKDVMCASLRSLLPTEWDIKHEVAWKWFWQKAARNFTLKSGFSATLIQSDWSKIAKEQPPPPEGENPMMQVPVTFAGMMTFNQMILSKTDKFKTDMSWTSDFPPLLSDIVDAYSDPGKYQGSCEAAGAKLKGRVTAENLAEFKPLLMCSLRSLLPARWSPQSEAAWGTFWKKTSEAILVSAK